MMRVMLLDEGNSSASVLTRHEQTKQPLTKVSRAVIWLRPGLEKKSIGNP